MEKKNIFPHFSRILPLEVRQRLFTVILDNLQEAVFRQLSFIFSTEQIKIKAWFKHRKSTLPDFFQPYFII